MTTQAELESQVRQLEQRNAATAEELRCSRDREKALLAEVERLEAHAEDVEQSSINANRRAAASEARVAALEGALREARKQLIACDAALREDGGFKDHAPRIVHTRRAISDADRALAAAVPPKSPDVELYEAQERFVDARRAAAVPQPPRESAACAVEGCAVISVNGRGLCPLHRDGRPLSSCWPPDSPATAPSLYIVTNGMQVAGMYSRVDDAQARAAKLGTDPNIWAATLYKPSRGNDRMRALIEPINEATMGQDDEGPAVPQSPPKQLVDEQFNDKFFDEMVRQGSPDPRRRISNVTKVYPMGQDKGPAAPQPPPDVVDEAVETRAREAMIEPTSTNKLSGRWEGPATPEQAAECLAVLKGEPTPAPQREPCEGAMPGSGRCGETDCVDCEAPPAGEPTPDLKRVRELVSSVARMLHRSGQRNARAQLVEALGRLHAIAAQPAPASPDHAALGLPSTVQECHAEILRLRADRAQGASPPCDGSPSAPVMLRKLAADIRSELDRPFMLEHRRVLEGWAERIELRATGHENGVYDSAGREAGEHGYAPTVSREVDEAASTNAAIIRAHKLLTNRGVHPGIVGERNSIARLHERIEDHVQPSRRVQREVDEAAVRASEREAIAAWLEIHGGEVFAETLRHMTRVPTERPAASGKDGAT